MFLLAQAGIPFTTGFLAKFEVVSAAVGRPVDYALAVIAMVSAAVAAFFYLRVAITMYSPVGAFADRPDGDPKFGTGEAVPYRLDPKRFGDFFNLAPPDSPTPRGRADGSARHVRARPSQVGDLPALVSTSEDALAFGRLAGRQGQLAA